MSCFQTNWRSVMEIKVSSPMLLILAKSRRRYKDMSHHTSRPCPISCFFPAPMGALTQLWGGTSPDTKDYNGEFLIPWARLGTAGNYVLQEGQGEVLLGWIEQQRYGH
ncbi:hypothetical protein FRC03_012478 [Tulasnella sp. 419]|nr:hypothetical protein FRC03_012478 [Tulasnella sp. 419]